MSEYLLPYSGQEIINKLEAIDELMNGNSSTVENIAATATGENIVIKDGADAPMVSLKAEYEDQIINGYQLFDASKLKTPTAQGGVTVNSDGSYSMGEAKITINEKDGTVTIEGSGTATGNGYIEYKYSREDKLRLIRPGSVYSNYNCATTPYITYYIYAWGSYYTLDNYSQLVGAISYNGDLDYDAIELKMAICIDKGDTIRPGVVKPMIYQDGDGTWEPYTDKQQQAKNLTLDIYGGNLLDYNAWKNIEGVFNGTANFVNNGVELTATGADCYTHYSADHSRVLRIPTIPGQEATLSWDYVGNSGNTVYVFNKGSATIARTDATNKKLSFTVPNDCDFITFRVGCANAGTTATYKNIMLNLGNSAFPFEVYKEKQSFSINKLMSADEINAAAQSININTPTTTVVNDGNAHIEIDYFKNNTDGKAVGKILKANVDLKKEVKDLKESINQLTAATLALQNN